MTIGNIQLKTFEPLELGFSDGHFALVPPAVLFFENNPCVSFYIHRQKLCVRFYNVMCKVFHTLYNKLYVVRRSYLNNKILIKAKAIYFEERQQTTHRRTRVNKGD